MKVGNRVNKLYLAFNENKNQYLEFLEIIIIILTNAHGSNNCMNYLYELLFFNPKIRQNSHPNNSLF